MNGLRSVGTDLLIICHQPGVQCEVEGKSSDTSRVFTPISPGTHLELSGRAYRITPLTPRPNQKTDDTRNQTPAI